MRQSQTLRSQVATELLLNGYAVVATVIVLRLVLEVLGVSKHVWFGGIVYRLTDPVVKVMAVFPGARQPVIGSMTMVDVTLVAMVILFPLGLVALGPNGKR
jgi:uncharacterized protein YggT (Ycf19 family)